MEDESRIPAANIPNLEANTTVNAVIGTMVCRSGQVFHLVSQLNLGDLCVVDLKV